MYPSQRDQPLSIERNTLETVQEVLEAAANALAPAFVTSEPTTLVALHAAITEFAAARILVVARLMELAGAPAGVRPDHQLAVGIVNTVTGREAVPKRGQR
jgi:hypothetical protein